MPKVRVGRIERLPHFASRYVAARHVDVWRPPDAQGSSLRRPVVYLHDGQMLFDAAHTWNRKAWQAHEAALALSRTDGAVAASVPAPLLVGIWNAGAARHAEYFPQRALSLAPASVQREFLDRDSLGRLQADAYLRFMVEELKPEIDRRYHTLRGPDGTFVAGASMGGLISLYALCEYPSVFGGAAALSAHWPGRSTGRGLASVRNSALPLALLRYLESHLPTPGRHRVWLDRGTDALDSLYAPALSMAAEVLRERGYGPQDSAVRVFENAEHDEVHWGRRLGLALHFLLGPP